MEIKEQISLKDKNWFRTGGSARYYCEPTNDQDFVEALKFAKENNLEIFVLGEGANILISDEGFDGIVIHPMIDFVEVVGSKIEAGSGVKFSDLITSSLESNLLGLEEFSGIPGAVGGSVYINIHYFEFLISQFLTKARVVDRNTFEILEVDNDWFEFGYDKSKLQTGGYYLLSATFALKEATDIEASFAKGRSSEIIRHRQYKYPKATTCGSFFRNFKPTDECYPILPEINGRKMIYVAYYLDNLGVKGTLRVGNASVSSKHANMIEALEGATSTDIINLVRKMQELVKEKYGFVPQPECQLVGFREYPLF